MKKLWQWLKSLGQPKFTAGDRLVDISIDFPNRYDYITILDVGPRQYKWKYTNSNTSLEHSGSHSWIEADFQKID